MKTADEALAIEAKRIAYNELAREAGPAIIAAAESYAERVALDVLAFARNHWRQADDKEILAAWKRTKAGGAKERP